MDFLSNFSSSNHFIFETAHCNACRLDGEQKSLARPPSWKYPYFFLNLLIASLFIFASSSVLVTEAFSIFALTIFGIFDIVSIRAKPMCIL